MGLRILSLLLIMTLSHPLSGSGRELATGGGVKDSLSLARKHISASRIIHPPKIDGILDEPFWDSLPVADAFVVYAPGNGNQPSQPTEIRFAYTDDALFVGAVMFESEPDSICKELGRRDQIEILNTDYISIDILPYNDGLNMYEFKVSPANLQNDCKYSAIGQDFSWDAVWESATTINAKSWVAELRIPYSALRFPKSPVQEWGINMWRNLQRKREYSTWTFVDNKDQDIFKYYGTLRGIEQIDPPLRLSFTPYLAGYMEKSPESGKWNYSARGGLDLRLGINESYTLDMMLIPDFGQVQSDDIILNLTPFEVRYDEKRQFFSEATELFNKCGIFYSRRIGAMPRGFFLPYASLNEHETVSHNPDETRIINATKISGRNEKGLGIGFFNAMTLPSYAEIKDTLTGRTRSHLTQDFTNSNVMVLDQNLKNNSYATLINTNSWIPGENHLANVTGLETRLNTKKRMFAFTGRFNVSQIKEKNLDTERGYQYMLAVSKPNGNFQYELSREVTDSKYNPNDLGYLTNNNEIEHFLRLSWNLFDPVWKFHSSYTNLLFIHSSLFSPSELITYRVEASNMSTFRNLWSNYLEIGYFPKGYADYYEPRLWGWKYQKPASVDFNWRIASDLRKAFRIHNSIGFSRSEENDQFGWFLETTGRMRFSNRFTITLSVGYDQNRNDYGWVSQSGSSSESPMIFFGRRDVTTISNVLNLKYIQNTRLSFNLRGRHYWSRAEYFDYYLLKEDGHLDASPFDGDPSLSFNVLTADLQVVWYFAPGSEISMVWKNYINTADDQIHLNYREDFKNTITSPQANSFSIRILYYLDYLKVKAALK